MGKLPNFLIIGAAKAGTTSIAQYLDQHPQVYISTVKEPFFFSFKDQSLDFSGPGDSESLRLAVTSLEEYEQLFAQVSDESAIGEASTSYLYTPQAPQRIHKMLPGVKLVAILRNPVEAAYSSFLHQTREGFEPEKQFSEALAKEELRRQENWMFFWHYKHNGFYYQKLKRYYDLFPPEQIKIYLFDDFKQDPMSVMKDLFAFLEVDGDFEPDLSVKFNISGIPRSRFFHKFVMESRTFKQLLRPLVPQQLRQKARQLNLDKPALPNELKVRLAQEYQQDLSKLQTLIHRDLSGWLEDS